MRIPGRWRNPGNDRFEHLYHTTPFLCADLQGIGRVQLQDIGDRLLGAFQVGTREIDLIDDRDNCEIIGHSQIHIGNRLSLYPLRGIDEQERTFTGRQTARDFIGKIDVTRRIDQVQRVRLPVLGLVPDRDRVGLDRDSTFTLQVHRVENLVFRFSGRDWASTPC